MAFFQVQAAYSDVTSVIRYLWKSNNLYSNHQGPEKQIAKEFEFLNKIIIILCSKTALLILWQSRNYMRLNRWCNLLFSDYSRCIVLGRISMCSSPLLRVNTPIEFIEESIFVISHSTIPMFCSWNCYCPQQENIADCLSGEAEWIERTHQA